VAFVASELVLSVASVASVASEFALSVASVASELGISLTSDSNHSASSATHLVRQRLVNQGLAASTFRDARDVVDWFGAVQAQDFQGAKWALGLRARAASDASVEAAYNAGDILRTHVLRPTWHFVTPADIRWLVALTGPRIIARMAPRHRQLELDSATIVRSCRTLERALSKADLTRRELTAVLERAGIRLTPQRLSHLLMISELEGRICSGPLREGRLTHALTDRRAPASPALPREEALAVLAQRYFRSHGPATLADFSWWSGLTIREARAAVEVAGDSVAEDALVRGAYRPAGKARRPRAPRPRASLLPNFDEYLVAYRDRSAILGGHVVDPWDTLANTLIVDGLAAGGWRVRRVKDALAVEVAARRRLSGDEIDRVAHAVARYGSFLRQPVTFERRPRSARPWRRAGRGASAAPPE
jgi:Winged helix DNA-binding domain